MENKEIEYIQASEGATLVSQFMDTLPLGILNKKRTGCGATSVALENHENVIVCCPTIQLIKNKVSQYPNERCPFQLFGVIGGIKQDDIREYIDQCDGVQPVKIMVTYNSFFKVKEAIGEDVNKFKIIVDEYQELLDSCVYREPAILQLLSELEDLPNVTYLSATPIPINYRPNELLGLAEYEIIWQEDNRVAPYRFKTNKPYALVINMIQVHKLGSPLKIGENEVKEYFFFLNSVTAIKEIIDKAGLTNDEVKVICADNTENQRKLGDISISDLVSLNKTFTFCTKTVFCGADFHSESGLAIVVSNSIGRNTMLDIATDIQQIAGRIRTQENPFKNIVLHIYSTGLNCRTQAEFDLWLGERMESAQAIISAYNRLAEERERGAIIERIKLNDKDELALYDVKSQQVVINTLKVNHFKYKFESIDEVYRNGMSIREAYLKAGCDLSTAQQWEQIISDYAFSMNRVPSFKALCLEYLSEKEKAKGWGGVTDRIKEIESKNELVKLAYEYLTPQKLEALRYNSTDVKNAVHFELPDTQIALKSLLGKVFIDGGVYGIDEAKVLYQKVFDDLQIEKRAKVTELKERYLVTEDTRLTTDGRRKRGIRIISKINVIFAVLRKRQPHITKEGQPNIFTRAIKKIVSLFSVKQTPL